MCDKSSRIKQYLKDGRARRVETVVNDARDLGCNRMLSNLAELETKARTINTNSWRLNRRPGQRTCESRHRTAHHTTVTEDGCKASGLRFGDLRVQALAGVLANMLFAILRPGSAVESASDLHV